MRENMCNKSCVLFMKYFKFGQNSAKILTTTKTIGKNGIY